MTGLSRNRRFAFAVAGVWAASVTAASAQVAVRSQTTEPGGLSSAAGLRLHAVIGQPDTGALAGGLLRLSGGHLTPARCKPDFNGVHGADLLDIFGFLEAWFVGDLAADYSGLNGVDLLDIFQFLQDWFRGC